MFAAITWIMFIGKKYTEIKNTPKHVRQRWGNSYIILDVLWKTTRVNTFSQDMKLVILIEMKIRYSK